MTFASYCGCLLRVTRGLRKTRPLGGNSSNHLTVITAEHHINLLTHGEVTHSSSQKDNKKRCCDVEADILFLSIRAACGTEWHATLLRDTYFMLHMFSVFHLCSAQAVAQHSFNICCVVCKEACRTLLGCNVACSLVTLRGKFEFAQTYCFYSIIIFYCWFIYLLTFI